MGAYARIRQGDVLTLPWSAYDGDVIAARASKTNEPIWVPAHSELRKLLSAAPRKSPIIVVGVRGHPFTSNDFRTRFFRVIRPLEMSGKIGKGLTFHGLRHTAATALADAGCDTRDIMSITGHKTEAMVARYTQSADQKRRARSAIAKLEGVNSEQTTVKPDAANCKTAKLPLPGASANSLIFKGKRLVGGLGPPTDLSRNPCQPWPATVPTPSVGTEMAQSDGTFKAATESV